MLTDWRGEVLNIGDTVKHRYEPVPWQRGDLEMTPEQRLHHYHSFFGTGTIVEMGSCWVHVKTVSRLGIPIYLAELVEKIEDPSQGD